MAGPATSPDPGTVSPPRPNRRADAAFVAVLAGFVVFVFAPIAAVSNQGILFGGDWGQYLITSHAYLHGQFQVLSYPYPVLPLLYIPVELAAPNVVAAALAAETIGGLLLIAIFVAAYSLFEALTRSKGAALLAALFLGTTPLFLDELGWAGQAQFLAIALGLAALSLYLRRVGPDGALRPTIVVSLLLTIAGLTEAYSTAFFLFAIVAHLLLVHRRAAFGRTWLVRGAILLVPAVVALALLTIFNPALAGTSLGGSLATHLGYGPLYVALFERLTFHSPPLEVLYPVVAGVYVLLWPKIAAPDPARRWLVPALALAWVPMFVVLTPAVDTDRSLYFALPPLAAMIGEIAAGLPALWDRYTDPARGRAPRPTRWGPMPRGRAAVLPVLAVAALLTVGVQVGVSSYTAYGSLTYYGYPTGVLQQLTPLASENGTVLLLSPNLGSFSAAWAAGLNTYFGPPTQPAMFTRANQQQAVITGTLLSNGPAWIAAGNTWVVNSEPTWQTPAPAILEYQGLYLVETLSFNDSLATVTFSPTGSPLYNETLALSAAPSIVASANATALTTVYGFPGVTVTKTVSVAANGTIDLDLSYRFSGVNAKAVTVALSAPALLPTTTNAPARVPSSVTVQQTYRNGYLPTVFTNTVALSAPGLSGTTVYVGGSRPFAGELISNLTTRAPNVTSLSVAMAITTGGLSSGPGTVVSEAPVLAANDLAWVAVERSSPGQYLERFLNDPKFTLWATEPYYLLFRTNWS
jgi:hypothetical protein